MVRLSAVDRCLERFLAELAATELRLADYMRLAELETMAADNGDEEVIVRWISCEEEESGGM